MGADRLDHSELDHLAHHFFLKGLASSILRAYRSAQRRYGTFCAEDGRQAVPASEEGLCRFVARLAGDGLKHRTIKGALAYGDYFFPKKFEFVSLCSFICLQAVYQLSGPVCKATWNGCPSYSASYLHFTLL